MNQGEESILNELNEIQHSLDSFFQTNNGEVNNIGEKSRKNIQYYTKTAEREDSRTLNTRQSVIMK